MTEFVAEVGANHNGDVERAMNLIDAAAAVGCSAVKFQFIEPGRLFVPEAKKNPPTFPVDWLPNLRLVASRRGLKFGCSVFHADSVPVVTPYVDFLKVSSYSVLDRRLLDAVTATKLPLVVGTGMASWDELALMLDWSHARHRVTLLHCVSQYPVAFVNCNLVNIHVLRCTFNCDVGWSDHSADRDVVTRAASRWQADMIECHFDLSDQAGAESGPGSHSWTPERLRDTISEVRAGEAADGIAVKPHNIEEGERLWRADPSDGLRPMMELRNRWK